MMSITEIIEKSGIIPQVLLHEVTQAVPMAQALCEGGLPLVQISIHSQKAAEAISSIKAQVAECHVGAGAIVDVEQCRKMIEAGAEFICATAFDEEMAALCEEKKVLLLPVCESDFDIQTAVSMGLSVIRVEMNPEEKAADTIKRYIEKYPELSFVVNNIADAKELRECLKNVRVIAGTTCDLAGKEQIRLQEFDVIADETRKYVNDVLNMHFVHMGMNLNGEAEAEKIAKQICFLFRANYRKAPTSSFAGEEIECLNATTRGTHGHIAFGSRFVERAMFRMELAGSTFVPETFQWDEDGKIKFAYIQGEFGGFAIHLIKTEED